MVIALEAPALPRFSSARGHLLGAKMGPPLDDEEWNLDLADQIEEQNLGTNPRALIELLLRTSEQFGNSALKTLSRFSYHH